MRKLSINEILGRIYVDPKTGCHNYQGSIHSRGYGSVSCGGRNHGAHKFFFEHYKGKVPDGLEVCHKCHNKRCVNPDHLYAGTHHQNMADMVEAGRQARGDKIAKHKRGANNAAAKLNDDQVSAIRKAFSLGQSQSSLAMQYGVHVTTAHEIVRLKTWQHVKYDNGRYTLREVDCS